MKKELITIGIISIFLGFVFLGQSCTKEVEVIKIETRVDTVFSHSVDTLIQTDTIIHLDTIVDTIIIKKPILRIDTIYKDIEIIRIDTVYKVLNQLELFRYGIKQTKNFDGVKNEDILFCELDNYDFIIIRYKSNNSLWSKSYFSLDLKTGVYQIKELWVYYYWEDGSLNNLHKTICDPKVAYKFIIK